MHTPVYLVTSSSLVDKWSECVSTTSHIVLLMCSMSYVDYYSGVLACNNISYKR